VASDPQPGILFWGATARMCAEITLQCLMLFSNERLFWMPWFRRRSVSAPARGEGGLAAFCGGVCYFQNCDAVLAVLADQM
jgi:hypothetical protein